MAGVGRGEFFERRGRKGFEENAEEDKEKEVKI
jgi:hypothetical protein